MQLGDDGNAAPVSGLGESGSTVVNGDDVFI